MRYKIPKFILLILAITLLVQFRPLEIEWQDAQVFNYTCLRQLAYEESGRGPGGEPLRRSTRFIQAEYVQGKYGEAILNPQRREADGQFGNDIRDQITSLGYYLIGVAGGGDNGVVFSVLDQESGAIFAFKVFARFQQGRGRIGRGAPQNGNGRAGENQFGKETRCLLALAGENRPDSVPEFVRRGTITTNRTGTPEFFDYYVTTHFDGIDLDLLRRSPYGVNALYHIFQDGMGTLEGPRLLADAMTQMVEGNAYMLGRSVDHHLLPRNIMLKVDQEEGAYRAKIRFVDFGDSGTVDPQGFVDDSQPFPHSIQVGLCGLINEPTDLPWSEFLADSLILATYPADVADMFRTLINNAANQSIGESKRQLAAIQERLDQIAQTTQPHAIASALDGDDALAVEEAWSHI